MQFREIVNYDYKYNNKYGFEMGTDESITNIRNKFFKLETIDKPIKALSSYKLNELVDICNKLSLFCLVSVFTCILFFLVIYF